ncbi:delta-1-pyrroline-5-carboxylate dehydrogenase, mitochondrial-like [Anticarsia gemmatalis]|uniref:delta-1-pyrroline-5-carboxylate dehydrogenase, mitochondrial-like n=1 Tax=Anticarsia gemmatalis TaxID=129554 RepID=UPI003F76E356
MFRVLRKRLSSAATGRRRGMAVFPSPEALEQPSGENPPLPPSEVPREPCVGSCERENLCYELTALCNRPPVVPTVVGTQGIDAGVPCAQAMPFQHTRVAAYYCHATPDTVQQAAYLAACNQYCWERCPIDDRCAIFEKAADLIADAYRQRIVAAAMMGQSMTAIQAEYNLCQLVDYLRYGCIFMRDLTKSRCVVDGGTEAYNRNQYHGLEGFWAAITPSDSFGLAAQLAITPAITGNCVVWKPSDNAMLACHRVYECLQLAGLPPGVINFVPAERETFLQTVGSSPYLAGISFAGTTSTLEHVWRTVGQGVHGYARFPRIVGTGSGKNFHVVHSSANLENAVACTARAAFEMAGQKSSSCSRVFVERSVSDEFIKMLADATKQLFVCHPLDYRCFTSSLVSMEAYDKVVGFMSRAAADSGVQRVCGGRHDCAVGYYVQPTVYRVEDPGHELLTRETRGPLLAVCVLPDRATIELEEALHRAPYAITGSIFVQDEEWSRWAVGALRDFATTLYVNDRCSEERPAQQSVGGSRKSGTGAKAGSISYLLHFSTERSLREALELNCEVTYPYMREVPPDSDLK